MVQGEKIADRFDVTSPLRCFVYCSSRSSTENRELWNGTECNVWEQGGDSLKNIDLHLCK